VLRRIVRLLPSLEEEMLLLGDFARTGGTVLDIGASYGLYTAALARAVGRDGTVHAFEPRPRSRRLLRLVRAAFPAGTVRLHPVALSDHHGESVLVTPRRRLWRLPVPGRTFLRDAETADGEDGYSYAWRDEFGGAAEVLVPVRRLDELAERIDLGGLCLVKIDVEGAELQVLAGAERTLAEHRPTIICEVEQRHTSRYGRDATEVLVWLASHGYRATRYADGELEPVSGPVDGTNNYVFRPG
jgi:FkbM family methyltransferase